MNTETYKKLLESKTFETLWFDLLNASGFAGCMPNGNIVDRRYFPESTPISENKLLGIEKPKIMQLNHGAMATVDENNIQLLQSSVSSSINKLLLKFDNGLELYQNNPVFANCIEHLLRGGDIYKIFEQIIVMQQEQQKCFSEIISSGTIRQEIIV